MTEILHLPTGQVVNTITKPEEKNPFQNLIAQEKILISFAHKPKEATIYGKPAEPDALIIKSSEVQATTIHHKKHFARQTSDSVTIKRPQSAKIPNHLNSSKAQTDKSLKNPIMIQKATRLKAKVSKPETKAKTEEDLEKIASENQLCQVTVKNSEEKIGTKQIKKHFSAQKQGKTDEPAEPKAKNAEEEAEKLRKLKVLVMSNIKKRREIEDKKKSEAKPSPSKSKKEIIGKIEEEAKEILKKTQLKQYQPTGKWGVDERLFKEKKEEELWKKDSESAKKAYRDKVKQEGRARIGLELVEMYPNLLENRKKSAEIRENSQKPEKTPNLQVQNWMKEKKMKEKQKQAFEEQLEQEKLRKKIQALKELEMLAKPQRITKPPTPNREIVERIKNRVEKIKKKRTFTDQSSERVQEDSGSFVNFIVDSEKFDLSPLNKDKTGSLNKKKKLKIDSFEIDQVNRESKEISNYSEEYGQDFESESKSSKADKRVQNTYKGSNGKAQIARSEAKGKENGLAGQKFKGPGLKGIEKRMGESFSANNSHDVEGEGSEYGEIEGEGSQYEEVEGENSQYEEEGSQYEEEGSQYEEEGSQYEEEGSQYEEEGSQYEEEGSQYEEVDGSQYEEEGSQYEEEESDHQDEGLHYKQQPIHKKDLQQSNQKLNSNQIIKKQQPAEIPKPLPGPKSTNPQKQIENPKKKLEIPGPKPKSPESDPNANPDPESAEMLFPGNSKFAPHFVKYTLHPHADESQHTKVSQNKFQIHQPVSFTIDDFHDPKAKMRSRLADIEKKIDEAYLHKAAIKIQAFVRGHLARKNFIRLKCNIPTNEQISNDIHHILLKYYPEAYVPFVFSSEQIPESISLKEIEQKDQGVQMQEVLPLPMFTNPIFKDNDEYNLINVLVKEYFHIESEASLKVESFETSEVYSEEFESASEDVTEIYNRVKDKIPVNILAPKTKIGESIKESIEGFSDSGKQYKTGSIKESIDGYSQSGSKKSPYSLSIKESIEGQSQSIPKKSQNSGSIKESIDKFSQTDSKKSPYSDSIKESYEAYPQSESKKSLINESIKGFIGKFDKSKNSSIHESFESRPEDTSNSKYSIQESFESDSKNSKSKSSSIKESYEFSSKVSDSGQSKSSIKESLDSHSRSKNSFKESEKDSFKYKKITESILESIEEHFPGKASDSSSSSNQESIKEKISESLQDSLPSNESIKSSIKSSSEALKISENNQSSRIESKVSENYEEDFESISSAQDSKLLNFSSKQVPKLTLKQKSSDPEIRFSQHQSSEFSESIKDDIDESIHYTDDFESEVSDRRSNTLTQINKPPVLQKPKILSSESESSESRQMSVRQSSRKSLNSSISEDLHESASKSEISSEKKPEYSSDKKFDNSSDKKSESDDKSKEFKLIESIEESIKYSDDFEDSKNSKPVQSYSSDFESVSQSQNKSIKGLKVVIKETSSEENFSPPVESPEIVKNKEKSHIYVEDEEDKGSGSIHYEEKVPKLQIPVKSDPESRFSQHKSSDFSESIQDEIAESIYSDDFESERSEKKLSLSQRSKSNPHKNPQNFNTKFPESNSPNSPQKLSARSSRKSPELRSSTSSISEDMDMYDSFSKQSVNLESSLRRSASLIDSGKGSKLLESIGESIQYSEDFESESKSYKAAHSYSSDFESISHSDSKVLKGLRVPIKEELPEESSSQSQVISARITDEGVEAGIEEIEEEHEDVDDYVEFIFELLKDDALSLLYDREVNGLVDELYRIIIEDCLRMVPSKKIYVNNPEYLLRIANRIVASTPDEIQPPTPEDILKIYQGEPMKLENLDLNAEVSLSIPADYRNSFKSIHKALKESVNSLAQEFELSLFKPVKSKHSKPILKETIEKWLNIKLGCIKPCTTQEERKQVSKHNEQCIKDVVNQELENEQTAWLNTEQGELKLVFELEKSVFSLICEELNYIL